MIHKVGIYSGTFDPIHDGHVAFAQEAIKKCKLDKLFFLVEPRPRRKQGIKALEHRQRMVHLVIEKDSKLGHIILGQKQFTVAETLPLLQARFKGAQLYFLMGDDMLTHFTDTAWPQVNDFVKATHLIIAARNRSPADVRRHVALLEKTRGIKISFETFETKYSHQKSTTIRQALRQGQQPVEINQEVYKYILENGLYSTSVDS